MVRSFKARNASRGLALRIKSELASRHSAAWPAIVIIGTGKNDSRLKDGIPEVTPEEFEQNLRSIIRDAQEVTEKIILMGIGPCADDEIAFKQYVYTQKRLAEYNDIVTKVADELGIVRVEVYDLLLNSPVDVFYRDKLHPNDKGYELICQTVKPVVMNMLEQ